MKKEHGFGASACADEDDEETREEGKENVNQRHKQMDRCLLKFIVSASSPFREVENKFLKEFASLPDKSYSVPTRQTIGGRLLDEEYERMNAGIQNDFRSISYLVK